ncbi:MAG: hypothetical protein U1F71_14305 [Verrucomicrobiaceae bacterium]
MKTHNLLFLVSLILITPALSQDKAQVTKLLKQLQSKDAGECYRAMSELEYSLDPRIPDACLPLLKMKDDMVPLLAARAIGSRWRQIPQARVPVFVQVLKPHLQDQNEQLVNMARRGIALLTRDYSGPMVSRSKSKRWVIYGRHELPCLIDTEKNTEELLNPKDDSGIFLPAESNDEVAGYTFWHPEQDMVALSTQIGRLYSMAWVWRHEKGLRRFTPEEIAKTLGHKEDDLFPDSGYELSFDGWKGAALDFRVQFTIQKGNDTAAGEAKLRWDSNTDKITVLSKKVTKD